MSVESSLEEITRRESRGSLLLWFGLLAPPLAWAVELTLNYSLEEWFACAPSTQELGEIVGLSVDAFALIATTVLTALSAAGLAVAIHCHRRLRTTNDSDAYDRARWMALAGILNGILYTTIIVVSYAVPLILDSCRTTP
jgi:hypothetical protein